MFATDQAPGVYYQTVDAGALPVTPLRTDITAFIGIAQRGPVDVPVPVESWQQFVSWFGGCIPTGYLAYAVRGFLENGGRRCWVVRIASKDPITGASASSVELSAGGVPVWQVRAASDGRWGDKLTIRVREETRAQVRVQALDPLGYWAEVPTLAGFGSAVLVRASQPGSVPQLRVASSVDPVTSRVVWSVPLSGFDPNAPLLLETVSYAIGVSEAGRLLRVYEGLSVVPEHPRYGPVVLRRVSAPSGATAPEPLVIEELRTDLTTPTTLDVDPAATLRLAGGQDGLASLRVDDFVGEAFSVDDDPWQEAVKARGLRAVERLSEIALLAVPDIHIRPIDVNPTAPPPPCVPDPCLDPVTVTPGPVPDLPAEMPPVFSTADIFRVQAEMVLQCEKNRDRFALLDPPYSVVADPLAGIRGVLDWRSRFDTAWAALSYPWLKVSDPVGAPGAVRLVPATGHIAGVVAGTDLAYGVHRAPANRVVEWALGPSVAVAEGQHAVLNQAGVNALRTIGARGLRLLGARTMSSDPDWRFVNVRRLMAMIEKALGIGLQWAVFEPNDFVTRARATMTVTFFLDSLQHQGMLAGATDEESFFVRCDLDNNPPEQRDLGQLVIEVGVAPAQPFEFIVLRVGRVSDSLQILEGGVALGATGTGV